MNHLIDRNISNKKPQLLDYYRKRTSELLNDVKGLFGDTQFKERAAEMNKGIIETRENLLKYLIQTATTEHWSKQEILEAILLITYTNYIVMMEARNDVWPYEYMTFSRRIGELWQPFCMLCWDYPVNSNIRYFIPPLFNDVRIKLTREIEDFIESLNITRDEKQELLKYYRNVWMLVSSGEIKLELDLHFEDGKSKYVIDFKSGFSSNEKGNTNRLLLVSSVYKILEEGHICEIYVRSNEEHNNHYLQTLKRSGLWNVYCGQETYEHIGHHTGFNLLEWINNNIQWEQDFDSKMYNHLKDNNLIQYLEW